MIQMRDSHQDHAVNSETFEAGPLTPRLLSVPELCRYLSMPRRTVYGYVARGRFPPGAVRRIGRALRFEKTAIDAWVSAQPTSASSLTGKDAATVV
ncbi:MAG: helix-turn-helix domain-containing protein [Elusimicrobia bacterium]|nr:helix-turn-helix domain-containing protein [Elusimicrobiota bacterium]